MTDFAKKLKEKRVAKNLSKSEVAEMFGWTRMYYGRYESGDLLPNKRNIDKFSQFIDIPVSNLYKMINNSSDETK